MKIEPYLFFEGCCEEALEFYRKALGAEITMIMPYKDSPQKGRIPPGAEDKVMHANLRIGDAAIMASDGLNSGKPSFEGFSLVLSPAGEHEAKRMFEALAEGGEVQMPLAKTFYSPLFGMVTDRFGMHWMIMVPAQS